MEALIVLVIGLPLGAAFWALFLRLFTKIVSKFHLAYGRAFIIMLIVFIINTITSFLSGSIIYAVIGDSSFPRFDILINVFLIQSFVFAKMINHPETGPIGLRKGFLLSLCIILVDIVIIAILSVPTIWILHNLLEEIQKKGP